MGKVVEKELQWAAASMNQVFLPDDHPKKYRGPLPSDLDVLLQLTEGLQIIHENGFVHRDVKPENVLISYPKDDGTVEMKWADFDLMLSKSVSSGGSFSADSKQGNAINWMAPETLAASLGDGESMLEPGGTVESDTWSAGCVFFAYLTKGKHPFPGEQDKPINLAELSIYHFAYNIIKEMIKKEPTERIKLIDVVNILKKVKAEETSQKEQEDNVRQELETGRLYSWEQWNLALKDGVLFAWSDDVAISGPGRRIHPKEFDKMKIACGQSGILCMWRIAEEEPGRKEGGLNSEMLQFVGITPGSPSRSPLNKYFGSQQWIVCCPSSVMGDKLIVKAVGYLRWEMALFGPLFHSTFHVTGPNGKTIVRMTGRAQGTMRRELFDLCSRPNPEAEDHDRIAALLQAGVDPNEWDGAYDVPLLFLCLENQDGDSRLKTLTILLDGNQSRDEGTIPRKVDLNAKIDADLEKNAFQVLLEKDANSSSPSVVYESLKILIQGGIDVNPNGCLGRTALHWLCHRYKHENIVEAMELIIENGVDVNVIDEFGRTALHLLCENYKNGRIVNAMKILIRKGASVKLKDKIYGRTALHYLCEHYDHESIIHPMKLLIDKGANVNLKDSAGQTALHCLCEKYKNDYIVEAIELLTENGIDVNVKDKSFERTALHWLCESYKNENVFHAMELLIENGANVNLRDSGDSSVLDYLDEDPKMAGYKEKILQKLAEKAKEEGYHYHLRY